MLRHSIPPVAILRVRCGCTLDPNSVCERHPCKCPECRGGSGSGTCKRRTLHTEYLSKMLSSIHVPTELELVTYIEALELAGKPTPTSPRERSLLNIMSYHVVDSMASSFLILDKSQSIFRTQMCPVCH